MGDAQTVSVDGHRLKVTNLEKVLYPETGTTKGDVLAYLAAVAPALLAHTRGRPATRKRWVHGVDGPVFFQKNLDDSTPEWVRRGSLQHKDHVNDYPLVDDLATLTWLGQIAALEVHVPQWRFGPDGAPLPPDRLVLDLDPGEGTGLPECAEVARHAREILQGMGLEPLPVTSGSKGIHLYAALDGTQSGEAVGAFAHELARALEADHPDLVVSDMRRTLRTGKVLVDWSQNNPSKTTIAPYSLRGRTLPTAAAPRTWAELDDPGLRHLDHREVAERLARDGDLLAPLAARQDTAAVDRLLAEYRAKRDARRTPEPVPEAGAGGGAARRGPGTSAPAFVIQEHHARRLHHDFRLEHDGVLVSWALPKGEPTDPRRNHLAVRTEDHPLEYATFEGTIPRGEYGAGEVTLWDTGTYEEEKWRADEVIVTLHGTRHGSRRLALIRTSGGDAGKQQWLIHRMADREPADGPAATPPDQPSPGRVAPMLATLGSAADIRHPERWSVEMKWDGIRALARVHDGTVHLTSRNGHDLTPSYPELATLAGQVDGDAVLDGEIVALDRRGRPRFSLLQDRMNLTDPREVEAARRRVGVQLMLFDVLEHDGRSVTDRDHRTRRELLERVVRPGGAVQLPPAFEGDLESALAASVELGLEGVVAKRLDGRYLPGRRGEDWIKVKHVRHQEVVVVGWRPGPDRRSHLLASLLLAVPDADGLRYAGRVGTGFSDRDRRELPARLAGLARASSPAHDVPGADAADARWIDPSLVGEVTYAEWTGAEAGEGRLRQASWRGWRPDKDPVDVRPELPAQIE